MIRHLFVYGTLRSDCATLTLAAPGAPARLAMTTHAHPISRAQISGRLISLGWYPGLLPAQSPPDRVTGEIWEMSDPDTLLAVLDAYEGEEYVRDIVTARTPDGQAVECWVWRYAGDATDAAVISSGDYRLHADGLSRASEADWVFSFSHCS